MFRPVPIATSRTLPDASEKTAWRSILTPRRPSKPSTQSYQRANWSYFAAKSLEFKFHPYKPKNNIDHGLRYLLVWSFADCDTRLIISVYIAISFDNERLR